MSFDGEILRRGFWIYVWRITEGDKAVLYVGRTGDSSSSNASSPFARIGQHLDSRPKARGNALARQLKHAKIDPLLNKFEMMAVGPIYEEQKSFDDHVPIRDKMAALERGVAEELKRRGYQVVGQHQSKETLDDGLFREVMEFFHDSFPDHVGSLGQRPKVRI
jgi:hypothetical protein